MIILELSKDHPDLAAYEVIALFNLKNSDYNQDQKLFIINKNLTKNEIKVLERLAYTKRIFSLLFETNKESLIKKIKKFNWNKACKKSFCIRAHFINNGLLFSFFKNIIEKDSNTKNPKDNEDEINRRLTNGEKSIETKPLRKTIKKTLNGNLTIEKNIKNKKTIEKTKNNNKNIKPEIEKYLASFIWKRISNPKVNLTNPKTQFTFFIAKNKIYAATLKRQINHNFNQRKAHKLPGLLPISLNPKLARAMINLTGIKKGTLLDPFCGTGGILIESALMNLNPTGYDINEKALKKCKANLNFLKIKNVKLKKADSLKWNSKTDYVATDLPYGINTKSINKDNFYKKFLQNLNKNLKKKAVLSFPHTINYKKLMPSNLKIEKEFSIYVHKSLTKNIVVIKR